MQELITFVSHHLGLSLAVGIIVLLLIVIELIRAKRNSFNITPAQTIHLINHEQAAIIDIRPRELFNKGHIIDAYSMTREELLNHPKKLEKFKNKPIIMVCQAGIESQKIAASLLKHGYNVYSLSGGIRAWTQAEMPLIKE